MSVWDDIAGHDDVRIAFRRAIARGRLTQAYLLQGPEGIGKQRFARHLAQALLCRRHPDDELEACGHCEHCRPFLAGTHPDLLLVEREAGKRILTVDKFIGSEDQRGKAGLCHDITIRPLDGSRKLVIINDADSMNEEAANALLKTLEEPPDGAILFLIVANPDAVLPTIRSRCQTVRFAPLSEAIVTAQALTQGLVATDEEARRLAGVAGGSLAAARRLAQPGLRELRHDWLAELQQRPWDGIVTARKLTERVEKLAQDTAEQRQISHWLLETAAEFYRGALRSLALVTDPRQADLAATNWAAGWRHDLDGAVDMFGELLERCQLAARHIEQNVSLGLCWEALCSDLARLSRPR